MSQSATSVVSFPSIGPMPLAVDFLGGRLTSEGGLPWLAEADAALALTQRLSSQPSFSRLENGYGPRDCYRLAHALGQVYLQQREQTGVPERIVLDLDGTDDPTHGAQERTAYHGYYGQYMYHPLLLFDGDTGQLITAVLRPGTVHASHGVSAILKRVVRTLRQRWPGVAIEVRADSGFAIPALYGWCEAEAIGYTIGLAGNTRLQEAVAPLQTEAEEQSSQQDGRKVRLLGETSYQAGSWEYARRVVMKAEVLAKGTNTRFVVTTCADPPQSCYNWYTGRG